MPSELILSGIKPVSTIAMLKPEYKTRNFLSFLVDSVKGS
jgi:hypothetical protein